MPRLLPENQEALVLYGIINTDFVQDFQALPLIFQIYKPRMSRREAGLLLKKLILIHDLFKRWSSASGPEGG